MSIPQKSLFSLLSFYQKFLQSVAHHRQTRISRTFPGFPAGITSLYLFITLIYTVFRKKTPIDVFFYISMENV